MLINAQNPSLPKYVTIFYALEIIYICCISVGEILYDGCHSAPFQLWVQ